MTLLIIWTVVCIGLIIFRIWISKFTTILVDDAMKFEEGEIITVSKKKYKVNHVNYFDNILYVRKIKEK